MFNSLDHATHLCVIKYIDFLVPDHDYWWNFSSNEWRHGYDPIIINHISKVSSICVLNIWSLSCQLLWHNVISDVEIHLRPMS